MTYNLEKIKRQPDDPGIIGPLAKAAALVFHGLGWQNTAMLERADFYFDLGQEAHLKVTINSEDGIPLIIELTYDPRGVIIHRKQFYIRDQKKLKQYVIQILNKYNV